MYIHTCLQIWVHITQDLFTFSEYVLIARTKCCAFKEVSLSAEDIVDIVQTLLMKGTGTSIFRKEEPR